MNEKIKYRMKHLARKFCRRNNVYKEFDSSVANLVEKAYLSAYLLCLHENKNKIIELEKENTSLKEQIEKMKCCENCKYNSYWGCSYKLRQSIKGDELVECKNMDKWEIKENDRLQ